MPNRSDYPNYTSSSISDLQTLACCCAPRLWLEFTKVVVFSHHREPGHWGWDNQGSGWSQCRSVRRSLCGFVSDADLFQAIAQGIPGKAEHAGGLALVSVGAAVSLTNDFVLPLIKSLAFG